MRYYDWSEILMWMLMWMLMVLFVGGVVCGVGLLVYDTVAERTAFHAIAAYRAEGQDYTRKLLTTEVVCLPRYRGADSLHVTGVR